MNASSEAAETTVRMGLEGTQYALKITGEAAKHIIAALYAIMRDKKQTKGKMTLSKMLKTGKPLNVFSVKTEELKTFEREAKRYGIVYTALIDKKNKAKDGMIDILVKEDDAPKINRIVERFKISTYDKAKIENEIAKEQVKNEKANKKEEKKDINPSMAKTEKSPLSEPSLNNKTSSEMGTKFGKKPSVKEELKNIKKEMEQKNLGKSMKKEKSKGKAPKNKTKGKGR